MMGLGIVLVLVFWMHTVCLALSNNKGLRVNRALWSTHSRREANRLIEQGRIRVNNVVVTSPDDRLFQGDTVQLDCAFVAWQQQMPHVYVKFNKPAGIVCTTDRRVPGNIVAALEELSTSTRNSSNTTTTNSTHTHTHHQHPRVFPIGRLDADSTGLILLTSDGSIVNPLLRAAAVGGGGGDSNKNNKINKKAFKEYHVETEPRATNANIQELASGIIITTMARRNGGMEPVTARTLACSVVRRQAHSNHHHHEDDFNDSTNNTLVFTISEGRNRQIRKMCAALGLEVKTLHRVAFAGITLSGCDRPGEWATLTQGEERKLFPPPTREEQRTPEERAKRKLKKLAKKRNK
jgi:23S rRNA pseudouridine2604 synthase